MVIPNSWASSLTLLPVARLARISALRMISLGVLSDTGDVGRGCPKYKRLRMRSVALSTLRNEMPPQGFQPIPRPSASTLAATILQRLYDWLPASDLPISGNHEIKADRNQEIRQ